MKRWEIPQSGPLFHPPLKEWRKIILEFTPPLKGEVDSLRRWILKGLRIDLRPWVVTGHQPSLFHPGIWARNFILEYLSSEFFTLYIVLDHDKPERVLIPFPRRDGKLRIVQEFFPIKGIKNPVERIPPPSRDELESFFKRIKEHIRTLNYHLFGRICRAEEKAIEALRYSENFSQFMKLWRRLHEGESNYREIFVSELTRSPVFRKFFLDIAEKAREFLEIYNESLREYRISHRIRTEAQPFPNLRILNGMVEVPFWIIVNDERKSLFIKGDHLFADGTEIGKIDFDDPESLINFEIRPRAVTLSLFTRLFLSNLFIHGIGGAKYQEIVDVLIEKFYSVSPPPYAVVTLSMGLSIPTLPYNDKKMKEIENLEREILYHPEKFVSPLSKNYHLVEEKKMLIREIGRGKDRSSLGKRIREINEILLKELEHLQNFLDNEKKRLMEIYEDWRVLKYREFPFILFNPQEVRDVLFQKVGSLSGGG
jgi:hypothetical protein